jgi:hypothetical protein
MNDSEFTIQFASSKEAQVIRHWIASLSHEIETLKKINDDDMKHLTEQEIIEINESSRDS